MIKDNFTDKHGYTYVVGGANQLTIYNGNSDIVARVLLADPTTEAIAEHGEHCVAKLFPFNNYGPYDENWDDADKMIFDHRVDNEAAAAAVLNMMGAVLAKRHAAAP